MKTTHLATARGLALSLSLIVLGASLAAAQDRPRRGDDGRQGRFGGGMGRGGFGDQMSKTMLLRSEQVQKELGLSDEQKQKVEELLEAARTQGREQFAGLRDLSREERQAKLGELREQRQKMEKENEQKIEAALDVEQVQRLNEIELQLRGVNALTDDDVAAQLKLTEDQKTKLRETFDASRQKRQELFEGARGGEGGRERFAELREKAETLRTEADNNALAVLTAEQKAEFERLKGKKFDLDRRAMFQRDRGARGEARRGDGPRGERGDRRPRGQRERRSGERNEI